VRPWLKDTIVLPIERAMEERLASDSGAARRAQAARWAAWLFAAAGVLGLASLLAPADGERNAALVSLLAVGDLVVAAMIATRPRHRWNERRLVVVALAGLAMTFLFALAGAVPSFGYPTFFLLLFAWVGTALPRGSSLRLCVPGTAAYVLPLVVRDAPTPLVASVVVAVPVMVLIGECTGAVVGRLDELNARLSHTALSDDLTGIGNRRRADELVRGIDPGDGVIMIDLDHFKQVNDRDGHSAGDRVLAELGSLLRRTVRGEDLVARYGGDEFLVIAPRSGDRALLVAERIVERWRELPDAPTLSLGVAVRQPHESAAETLGRADDAVYAAKRAGRNRVSAGDPETPTRLPQRPHPLPRRSALSQG
jgi:diguanylate cyclase (GGDEF)-like protein